jgi:hypothetical protein
MMEAKIDFFYNQFHSQTSSKTYPYPKGVHMGAIGAQICDYLKFDTSKSMNCRGHYSINFTNHNNHVMTNVEYLLFSTFKICYDQVDDMPETLLNTEVKTLDTML